MSGTLNIRKLLALGSRSANCIKISTPLRFSKMFVLAHIFLKIWTAASKLSEWIKKTIRGVETSQKQSTGRDVQKSCPKIFAKFKIKQLCCSLFYNNVTGGCNPQSYQKETFAKVFSFLQETSEQMLLTWINPAQKDLNFQHIPYSQRRI